MYDLVVDMSAWLQYFAFDCIGEINFSQPMGFMDSDKDVDGICQLDHEMMMYFALVSTTSSCHFRRLTNISGAKSHP